MKEPRRGTYVFSVEAIENKDGHMFYSPNMTLRKYKVDGDYDPDGNLWVLPDNSLLNNNSNAVTRDFNTAKQIELDRLLDIQKDVNEAIEQLKGLKPSSVPVMHNPYF
jgi:hypothetical protein